MAVQIMSQGAHFGFDPIHSRQASESASQPEKFYIPDPEKLDPHTAIAASQLMAAAVGYEVLKTASVYLVLQKMAENVMSQRNGDFALASQQLQDLDAKMEANHKAQEEAIKKKRDEEKTSKNWGVALRVFSWVSSFLMIITGGALIASAVSGVGGALMMAGGLISVGSQILDVAGGWRKILDHLPGKNLDEKAAVLSWIQIAILVLSCILSASGVVLAGHQSFSTGSQLASALIGGTAVMGQGACMIGKGRADSAYYEALSDIEKTRARSDEIRFEQQDIMEMMKDDNHHRERGFDAIKAIHEGLDQVRIAILRAFRRGR